uniref:CSON005174 protein n=1 Tax=Culicoides sonorensis TaxID=179676 RepID=A0A336LUM0_CULSO
MAPNSRSHETISRLSKIDEVNIEEIVIVQEQEWLFDDAINLIGFGLVQYRMIFICGLMLMAALNETMGMMFLMTPAQCDLELNSFAKGLLTSSSYFGIMIPSYMWGYISDRYGRRKVIIYTLFATSVMAVCSSLSRTFFWFLFFRFWTGFFISAASGGMYPYLGEFNTMKNRPTVMAWCSCGTGISMTAAPIIAWAILSLNIEFTIYEGFVFHSWRLIIIAYTLPGLLAAIFLIYCPESPKFYMAQGCELKALKVLEWIFITNTRQELKHFPVKRLAPEVDNGPHLGDSSQLQVIWKQTKQLFQPPYIKNFLIAAYIQTSIFISSGALGLWFPELLNRFSNSDSTGTICEVITGALNTSIAINGNMTVTQDCDNSVSSEAFINSVMVGVYYTLGYVLISMLMKPLGRGWILGFSLFGSAISGFVLQWITIPILEIIFFSAFLVLSGLMISVISGTAVMLFPTHIRAMAVCVILMVGRIGTSTGSSIVGLTIESHCEETFAVITAMVFVAAIFNFFLPSR